MNLNCFSSEPGQSFQTTTSKDGKVAEFGLHRRACTSWRPKRWKPWRGTLDRQADVLRALETAVDMEDTIWQSGWDGAWFRRAYDDFGNPVGSQESAEGQIFIEPQGICIMAGLGIEQWTVPAWRLDAVKERLATPHGIVLQQPAFSQYYLHLGEISSYPPGYKENAGIFCHTNPWIMIAEAIIGNGDMAHDYYLRINPSARE